MDLPCGSVPWSSEEQGQREQQMPERRGTKSSGRGSNTTATVASDGAGDRVPISSYTGDTSLRVISLQLDRQSRRSSRLYLRWQRARGMPDRQTERQIPPHLSDGHINPEADAVRAEVGVTTLRGEWPKTLAESLRTAREILRIAPVDLVGLSIRYLALLWMLFHDGMADSIDPVHLRQLRAFGRDLTRVAMIKG